MPAIRFYHQCVYLVVDHLPSPRVVEVRMRDGQFQRLRWLGMICESAAETLPGLGYAKIRAFESTSGDGIARCDWYRLQAGEFVLGWRCELANGQGVYGVVDRLSCPIIVGERGRKGAPKLKLIA